MYIAHYGMPRRSGRYPYGSGKRPFQSGSKSISSDTYDKIQKIHSSLNKQEKKYLGETNISKYTKYANVIGDSYIILDDYGSQFGDVHPHKGLIISIASSPKSRGKGEADQLIQTAKKDTQNRLLIAEIDKGNDKSENLFKRNGFLLIDEKDDILFYASSSFNIDDYLKRV